MNASAGASVMHDLLALASKVKREVVETLRKVVDVMGKYAGQALSLEARNAVRGFILDLPRRWASIQNALSIANASNNNTTDPSRQEAERVLTLAHESHSVLQSTTHVVHQSISTVSWASFMVLWIF